MKKVVSLVLALLLALPLAGCSGSKPDTVVTTFCSAVQALDFEKAATCMENGSEDLEDPYDDAEMEEDLSSEQVMAYLKECASKMTYKIGESKVDGESATVPVSFTYVDAGPVITSALGEYITQAFAMAFSGADDAQMEELFGNIFMEKTKSVEAGSATADVTFNCVKVDGDWKIASFSEEDEEAITNILTSNIASAFEGFGNAFDDADAEEAPENTIWHDVPLGQEVELATIKICVTGCEEKNELKAEYFEPEVAQEGTKFVVFSVVIENITKDMFEQAVTLAKTDPRYEEYSKICELDYDLLCSTCKYDKLYRCEFDVVGEVTYGGSEGIYGDIFLYGNWSKERDDPFKSRACVYVLKTLKQDKESYMAVGMLVNLICYYANEFVATHLDRFD